MKILVYGSKGWIGKQFILLLKERNMTFVEGKSRTDNEYDLNNEIESVNPTHIISFIGRTHGTIGEKEYTTIDYLEQDGKLFENIRDNLYSPLLLSQLSSKKNIHYSYLGTGCIFKFDEEHPFGKEQNGFTEDALPNFFGSSYSIVKGFTDRIMNSFNNNVLNLRIRMPITGEENPRNFITKIVNYEKVCSVPNSMTVLPELLPMVIKMMQNNVTGTMNLTNPGLISHNEILEMYKEIVDPTFEWVNFTQEQQRKILAADRSNNFLDTTKLQTLFPELKNIKDSVRDCLISYKQKRENNKNILITGGCGFIGSNFINYYFNKNKFNKLINLDAMYYCANHKNIEQNIRNNANYKFIHGNLTDPMLIKKILKENNITHVIHFAAQSHVQNSFEDSLNFTNDNIVGTHTLLEECRKYGKVIKFIHVSTDEVYGESMNTIEESHKTEHSILCPTNPYAATKAGAELIAQSYCHSYKMPIIITRGNNVYGKNQYPEKVIPKFIKLLKESKKITIQGKGDSVRAFLHAYDTAKAFECILERGNIGEIYNIGCDEGMEYSILEVAKMLISMIQKTDKYDEWIEYIEDRPYNDMRYYISNQKVKELGWNIEIDLITGLKDLIDEKYKIELLNLKYSENLENKKNFFGDWINNIETLKHQFLNAEPFENIIIPNFLSTEYAELIYKKFPEDINNGNWHKYCNPLEVKYAFDDIKELPFELKQYFYLLSSGEISTLFSNLCDIPNLEHDPYLHGAGVHLHPKFGRLNMHLDYEKHPYLEKERRLNIILYMNKNWQESWNGETQLWDKDMKQCVVKSQVNFNTAIIFKTNEISWHGVPEIINCPSNIFRKTLAYYYISPLITEKEFIQVGNDGSGHRTKATFVKKPNDPDSDKMDKLFKIRPLRLITEDDLKMIMPEWSPTKC